MPRRSATETWQPMSPTYLAARQKHTVHTGGGCPPLDAGPEADVAFPAAHAPTLQSSCAAG